MSSRILVVDDQRANVEMIAGVLEVRGYKVDRAFSGEQALARIAEAAQAFADLESGRNARGVIVF